jgi:hypothetical protein
MGVKRLTNESSVSNRSSSSSGYGHLVHTFDPNSSDEDDVYSKPTESKNYTEVSTPPSSITNSLLEGSLSNINCPPPIPNRQSKRGQPLGYSPHSKSSEYILMPPCRVRELCAERKQSNGSLNSSMLDDSATSTLGKSLNESFHTADGSPVPLQNGKNGAVNSIEDVTDGARPRLGPGPPLPPRSSTISSERRSIDSNPGSSPVPVLPKRQPKKVSFYPLLFQAWVGQKLSCFVKLVGAPNTQKQHWVGPAISFKCALKSHQGIRWSWNSAARPTKTPLLLQLFNRVNLSQ